MSHCKTRQRRSTLFYSIKQNSSADFVGSSRAIGGCSLKLLTNYGGFAAPQQLVSKAWRARHFVALQRQRFAEKSRLIVPYPAILPEPYWGFI